MRIEFEYSFSVPVERVFPYLADPTRWGEYISGVVERRQITQGPPAVGTTWSSVDKIGPFRVHFTDELTDLEPGRRVVFRQSAPWNSAEESICEPVGQGARVRVVFDGQPRGWLRLLDLMPDRLMARASYGADFKRLAQLLANQAE